VKVLLLCQFYLKWRVQPVCNFDWAVLCWKFLDVVFSKAAPYQAVLCLKFLDVVFSKASPDQFWSVDECSEMLLSSFAAFSS
jgi:hypothetical protein